MQCRLCNCLCSCFQLRWSIKHQVYISILFHKNLHTANTSQQTKLSIVYFIFIPSPIIGLTKIFSIFISILFKFENSSREIDTAKLTWPFIASHYGPLRGRSVNGYNIVQWTRQKRTGRDSWETALYFLCFASTRERCFVLYWVGLQTFCHNCSCS